jgi:hypothetical protein
MATSLYDLSVPTYLQTLGGVEGFLGRGLSHFQEKSIDPNEVIETRLAADMLPFRFQIWAIAHHSIGAMRGVKAGLFAPPAPLPALDYAGLQKTVTEARALELTPADVNALTADATPDCDTVAVHGAGLLSFRCPTSFPPRRPTTSCA